jgi:hypothetical protein
MIALGSPQAVDLRLGVTEKPWGECLDGSGLVV